MEAKQTIFYQIFTSLIIFQIKKLNTMGSKEFEIFEKQFGVTKKELGYSLTSKKVKSGILVMKWYQRNSWVDEVLEKKVLLSNGKIYENNKLIGNY